MDDLDFRRRDAVLLQLGRDRPRATAGTHMVSYISFVMFSEMKGKLPLVKHYRRDPLRSKQQKRRRFRAPPEL
jgi:hypothetical protein